MLSIILLFSFLIYVCVIIVYEKYNKILAAINYLLCLMIIVEFTFGQRKPLGSHNAVIIPFRSFVSIWKTNWKQHGFYVAEGLIGNIMLFVPLGVLLSKSLRYTWQAVCLLVFVTFIIEISQLATCLGTFEMDDIICNVLGGYEGYEIGMALQREKKGNFVPLILYLLVLSLCAVKSL